MVLEFKVACDKCSEVFSVPFLTRTKQSLKGLY